MMGGSSSLSSAITYSSSSRVSRSRWCQTPVYSCLLFISLVIHVTSVVGGSSSSSISLISNTKSSIKGTMLGQHEPEFLEPLQNVTVTAGRDIKLQCSVKHLGSYKVAWIYMERSAILTVQNHIITRNPRISVSHDQHHTWNLHIANVQESDRGGYMCQINTATAKVRVGYINVVVPPSIDDTLSSSDVTVREQSSVTLTCSATGTAPLLVRWRREDGKLININRTHTVTEWEGTTLEMSKVNRFDMAAYLCIASNGVPPAVSKRIILTVEFAPSVTLQQQLIGAPLSSTVSLDCQIESSPAALHFWSRSDGTVLHEASKYLMQQSTGSFSSSASGIVMAISSVTPSSPTSWPSFRTQLRLTIVNVTAKDYGAYRCVAKNPFGEADGVITFHHTQSASTTTVSYPRNPAPPVAAVSPELMQEMNQEGINSNQSHNMKLAGPSSAGKGRFSDNMLPDNNNDPSAKDLSNKSQKTRSGDTKWSFSWDPNAPGAKSGCAELTSTHPVWILVVTVMWLTRITSAVSAGSTRASSLMTAR